MRLRIIARGISTCFRNQMGINMLRCTMVIVSGAEAAQPGGPRSHYSWFDSTTSSMPRSNNEMELKELLPPTARPDFFLKGVTLVTSKHLQRCKSNFCRALLIQVSFVHILMIAVLYVHLKQPDRAGDVDGRSPHMTVAWTTYMR